MNEQQPRKVLAMDDAAGARTTTGARIPIRKSHVRRAIRAADAVCAASKSAPGQRDEAGVVLMTAVLLVERLARTAGCEPDAVLSQLSDCFELKRAYEQLPKRSVLT
jgi:hypothetical protein